MPTLQPARIRVYEINNMLQLHSVEYGPIAYSIELQKIYVSEKRLEIK